MIVQKALCWERDNTSGSIDAVWLVCPCLRLRALNGFAAGTSSPRQEELLFSMCTASLLLLSPYFSSSLPGAIAGYRVHGTIAFASWALFQVDRF